MLMQIEMFFKRYTVGLLYSANVIVCDTCDSFDVYVYCYLLTEHFNSGAILYRTYIE